MCRHKLAIIANDKTDIESQEQDKNFELAQIWIKGSALQKLLANLSDAEREVESAQARVKRLKKALETHLNGQMPKKE